MKQRDVWKRVLANAAAVLVICATLASVLRLYQNSHAAKPVARTATTPTVGTDNWPTYLYGNDHQGVNPNETTIGAANVSTLTTKWKFQIPIISKPTTSQLVAEPIVANGILYEGSWNGYMYAFDATTGIQKWAKPASLGTYRSKQCGARGGPSGSATYDNYNNGMIFVGSGPYMFALDANTGVQVWETKLGTAKDTKDNFSDHIWGSATVANGIVYVGIASLCDNPLTQGILYALDEATGAIVSQVDIVRKVNPGGGIWDAPTVDPVTGTVIVTTGSIGKGNNDPISPMEAAVVTLNWQTNANNVKTLTVNQFWQVPASERQYDADFGASPTLFSSPSGARYFGVINKNGIYYVFNEADVSAGPIARYGGWQRKLGQGGNIGGLEGSITTSDYFNGVLYITTSQATVMGKNYTSGSIGAFNALTGEKIWRVVTRGNFYAAPVIANGLLYDVQGSPGNPSGNLFEVRDLSGNVLFSSSTPNSPIKINSPIEASPTVVNGMVYIATFGGTLYALGLPQSTA